MGGEGGGWGRDGFQLMNGELIVGLFDYGPICLNPCSLHGPNGPKLGPRYQTGRYHFHKPL